MSGKIVTIDFRSDTLVAVEQDDGVYVALRPICESIGIDWSGQLQRVRRDPVLSEAVVMMPTPFGRHGQEEVCLKLDFVNGWLLGVDARRVKEAVRPALIEYQRECHRVLFDHFYGKTRAAVPTEPQLDDATKEPAPVRLRMVAEVREVFGARAAAELWFKLQLPITPAMMLGPAQLSIEYDKIKPAEERPPDKEQTAA